MSIFKCKMCGGTIEFEQGATVGVCDSCGTKQTLPRLDDDKKTNLYDRANHFRRNNDYDKAMGFYEQILSEDNTDAEAYWSLVLCKYGIEYVEDPSTHKRVPTVNRVQYTSVFADEDYKAAINYADGPQKELYEAEAKAIEEIQKGILAISQKEDPFDVFICYKETDDAGNRTPDSVLANDLYHQLTQEGFKVFFSRITLEDKLGQEYEPYIFAALNSAPVMVCLGTKPEFFNAVWVRNEWSRYLALVKKGEKKILIPAYKDMDPYDLPDEFSHLQAQDMSKLGFMQDLIRGIKKILDSGVPAEKTVAAPAVVQTTAFDADKAIKRALLFIEDGQNEEAEELLEKAIDADPQNVQAYIGKLLLEAGVKTEDQLTDVGTILFDSKNLERAIRFADDETKQKLTEIKLENAYRNGQKLLEGALSETDFEFAKAAFALVPDYKDSADLMEQCDVKAKAARAKKIYTVARTLMDNATALSTDSIENLNKAIEKFESITDYEDSEKRIDECKRRIEELRTGIEAKKAKNKKIALVAGIVIVVLIAFFAVMKTVIIPANDYKKAVSLLEAGEYDNAIAAFEAMGDYKDAQEKVTECQYQKAETYFKAGNYNEASKIYKTIPDYNDAQEKYNESIYQLALPYWEAKDLERSNPMFESIKDYKDAADKIHYHDWKKTKTVDATCTDKGSVTYKCSCGETKTSDIPARGHDWEEATCTEPKTCKRCGATQGSALGHTDGVKCSRCGEVLFETLKYSGTGAEMISGVNLPEGNYKITCTYDNRKTAWGRGHIDIKFYYDGNHYDLLLNDSQETGSISNFYNGSATNAYFQISPEEGCSWTITIELQ